MAKHVSPPEAEKDRSERWLLTYADMITLLLILFIVLYAMSSLNQRKMQNLSEALGVVFGAGAERSMLTGQPGLLDRMFRRRINDIYLKSVLAFQKEIAQKKMGIIKSGGGVKIVVASDFYFSAGSVELAGDAANMLKKFSEIFKPIPNKIRVEGHTDDRSIQPGSPMAQRYPSNWELSSQRAINVVKSLERNGIAAERLSAVAFGDAQPLKSNFTEAGRSANRRVELFIMAETVR